MLLWFLFALMTATVLAVVLRPLSRPPETASAASPDQSVYRDQLTEIDADLARGIVNATEAEASRREVARRLLQAADATSRVASLPQTTIARLMLGLGATIPMAAIALYLALGSPGMPAHPWKPQPQPQRKLDRAPIDDLVAKVEARLAEARDDGKGWDVVAPVYFRLQRYDEAANAYGNAIRLLGETPQRLAGFAEATVLAANGTVTGPARLAYEKLRALEPSRIEPRFWLALAQEQSGKKSEAAAAYRAMLADSPADAPWRSTVIERLIAIDPTARAPAGKPGAAASSAPVPKGPSASDIDAASTMTDRQRGDMIAGMVDGLAKRLAANPNDAPGWQRLIQSYAVLDDRPKAVKALADARRQFAKDATVLGQLSSLAKAAGLEP